MAYHPLLEQQLKAHAPKNSQAGTLNQPLLSKALLHVISQSYTAMAQDYEAEETQARIKQHNNALMHLSHTLEKNASLEEVLQEISRQCAQTLATCRAGVWLFSDDKTQLTCNNEYNTVKQRFSKSDSISVSVHPTYFTELATKRVMATRDAIRHEGNTTKSLKYLKKHAIKAMLDTPIKADGVYLGVLRVYQTHGTRFWHPDEQQFAASIADIIALAYQKCRRQSATQALNESENRFKALAESTGTAIFAFREHIIYANHAAEALTQFDQGALKLLPISVIFGENFSGQLNDEALHAPKNYQGIEIEFARNSGEIRWALVNVTQTNYDGQPTWLASAFDITERKRAETQMRYQAFHDNLTSLPNRTLLIEKIDYCLNKASRDRYYRFGMCQITLHNISDLNQQIGHSVGDHYLIDFALRLKKASHITDTLAKISQDTFIVVRENLTAKEQFIADNQALYTALNKPVTLEDNTLCLTMTMGLVYCDNHYHASNEVLRHCLIASEQARNMPEQNLSSHFCVFNALMHQNFKQEKELATRLRKAFNNHEFSLRYWPTQPLHGPTFYSQPQHDQARLVQQQYTTTLEPVIQWREGSAHRLTEGHFALTQKDPHFMRSLSYWLINTALSHLANSRLQAINIWVDLTHDGFHDAHEFETLITTIGQTIPKNCTVILQIPFALAQYYNAKNTPIKPAKTNPSNHLQTLLQKNNCQLAIDITCCQLNDINVIHNLPLSHVRLQPQVFEGLEPQSPSVQMLQALIHYCQSLGLILLIPALNDKATLNTILQLTTKMEGALGQGLSISAPVLPSDIFDKPLKTG